MENRPMTPYEYHAWYLSEVQRQDVPQYYIAPTQPPKKTVAKGKPKKRRVVRKSDVSVALWLIVLFILFLGVLAFKARYKKDRLQWKEPPPPKTDIEYKKRLK